MADNDLLYEYWLDAWCVAWAHIGEWHLFTINCGPAYHVRLWYQRGVMMGLLQAHLTKQRIDRINLGE
jgi:hypothetical protein